MGYDNSDVAAASPLATGGILYAPKGTALPTSATATLDAAFTPLGLVGEDGLSPSPEGATKTDLRAWGGDVVARVTESQSIGRWDFTLLSIFDEDVAKFIHGTDNVAVTPATTTAGTKLAISETGEEIANCVLVFDMQYEGKRMRVVLPDADPEVTGELPFSHSALSGYTISTTALKDDSGNRAYRYYDNDDKAPAA